MQTRGVNLLTRVRAELLRGVLRVCVRNDQLIRAHVHFHGDDGVQGESHWQDAVTLVVDVLANQIHAPGGASQQIGFAPVLLLEGGDEPRVSLFRIAELITVHHLDVIHDGNPGHR